MKKASGIKDPDLKGVEKALMRSAATALKLARTTRTSCYVIKEGKLVDIAKDEG